jgi:hypothetical protein
MEYIPPGFTPNHRRGDSIFAHLIGASKDGDFPYTKTALERRPQDQVPDDLHSNANFWFYLTHMMRGMLKSDYAAQQVVRLYRQQPNLFLPDEVVKLSVYKVQKQLESVFGKGNVPKHQRYAEAWFRNSKLLLAWDSDIRNVYEGVTTEAEVRARIVNKRRYHLPPREQGFFCFKAKMCSLLTYFLMDARLIPRIRMSPPIDFHHMRAMIGTGIIPLPHGRYAPRAIERLADQVGRRYLDRNYEMDPVHFADLLFVLSREGCARAVSVEDPDWSDPKLQTQYRRSCGRCPVEHKCNDTALQESYYAKGESKQRVIHVVPRPRPPSRLR